MKTHTKTPTTGKCHKQNTLPYGNQTSRQGDRKPYRGAMVQVRDALGKPLTRYRLHIIILKLNLILHWNWRVINIKRLLVQSMTPFSTILL